MVSRIRVLQKGRPLKKKRIIFLLPSLRPGGAERVMSFVASSLDSELFETVLLIIGFKKDSVYDVGVDELIYLNKKRLLNSLFSIYKIIRSKKPDIVVSSISHVNVYMGFLALLFRRTKFIGREASVLSSMSKFASNNQRILKKLMKIFYPLLDLIVCQSQDMKEDLIQELKLNPDKLKVIYNPITNIVSDLNRINQKKSEEIRFITVGRLSKEKGHYRILKGLSKINGYSFKYTIIGSGPLEKHIKKRVEDMGLFEKVDFIPYTTDVLIELNNSDFFLQGSFVEGFPNAVLESCTVGTPVIAFDAPGGTRSIIQHGLNGYIVKDIEEFISLLNGLKNQDDFSSKDIKEFVLSKFSSEVILNDYKNLFSSVG